MMMSLFSPILCTVAVPFLYGEYVVLFSSGWCFLPSKHGLIVLTSAYVITIHAYRRYIFNPHRGIVSFMPTSISI